MIVTGAPGAGLSTALDARPPSHRGNAIIQFDCLPRGVIGVFKIQATFGWLLPDRCPASSKRFKAAGKAQRLLSESHPAHGQSFIAVFEACALNGWLIRIRQGHRLYKVFMILADDRNH